jgi:hypothetical protein
VWGEHGGGCSESVVSESSDDLAVSDRDPTGELVSEGMLVSAGCDGRVGGIGGGGGGLRFTEVIHEKQRAAAE